MTAGSRTFAELVELAWPGKSAEVLGLIQGRIDPSTYENVRAWEARCYHPPSTHDRIACALNEALGMYGVEAIAADDCNMFAPPAVEYLNAGETYATTLLYVRGRWRVGDWGTEVERLEAGE